jgi:hypothetical protein
MLRKMILALCAMAAIGMVLPTAASARGGFGGFHGGGFHGGGFHGGGFRGGGFGFYGFGYPYYAYGGYPYYGYGGYDDGGCYLVRRPVRTPYGIRYRRVEVCS